MMMIFEIALITAHINRLKMSISRLTRFVNTLTNKFFFHIKKIEKSNKKKKKTIMQNKMTFGN